MKFITELFTRLFCYLWLHLYNSLELEKWWRYFCLNCWKVKKVFRSINFEYDIKPFLVSNNYQWSLQSDTMSFDKLFICFKWDKRVWLRIPSDPIYDWDIFLNDMFIKIKEKLW